MKLNDKEIKTLSVIIAIWGVFLIGSGAIMQTKVKPIINTKYSLNIKKKRIAQAQAKTNEIKLKDITIEINNPISVNIKDYLENVENISNETLKNLKLDTSLVNINQAGTYQYTISYKKKKYIANIIVKEKELPNMTFTLKSLTLITGNSLSTNPRSYIKENISDEVLNNITLDLSGVNNQTQGNYKYYIIYKGTKYQGDITITNPGPTIITKPSTPPATPEEPEKKDPELEKQTD